MKILIIYFSHTGNNRLLATELARRLPGDLYPVVEKRRRTLLTVFLDLLLNRTPAIEPLGIDLADGDHIVFVAPIWNSRVASPMAALLRREKASISSYSFISVCGHGRPGQQQSISAQLAELTGTPPVRECELRISALMAPAQKDDIRAISGYRIKSRDLQFFEAEIAAFCAAVTSSR